MKPLGKSFTMMCFVLRVWRGSSRSSHTRNRGRRTSSSAFGAHVPPRPISLSLHRPAGAFLFRPKVPPSSSLHPHSSMRGDRLRNCDAGSSSTVPLLSLSHRHCRQHFSSSTLSLAAASSSGDMREGEGVSPSMKRKVVNEVYDSLFYVPTNHPSGDKREDDQGRASANSSGSGQYSFYDGGGESSPSQRPRAQSSSRQSQRSTNSNVRNQQSQTTQQNTIQTTRALYQFRPLQPGSSRIMPPSTNSYDEELYDYNIGEDSLDGADVASGYYKTVNDELDNVTRKARIISKKHGAETQSKQKGNATASSPRLMGVRETSFFDEDVKGKPAESSERPSVPNFFDDEDDTKIATPSQPAPVELSTSMPTTTSSTSAAATPLPKPPLYRGRNVTPSFMEPTKIKGETSNLTTDKTPIDMDIASNGISITSHLTALEYQLEHLTTQIYQLNGGVEFNVNSPKQVARVLFGDDDTGDTSTNKDVLESLASAGNEMAASIYKYRKLSREIKREQKRIEQQEKGDKKNDYYGNLARHEKRIQNTATSNDVQMFETVTPPEQSQSAVTNTADGQSRREPLLLIDASAYIFRAYHAIPPLHHSDGTPTGALHGVCRMLQNLLLTRLLAGDRPRVVLAFDYKGPNFRHEIYPEYKANRGPCPEDLAPQFDLVREAAEALGVMIVEAEGYEADDVIATLAMLALEEGVDVDIFSGDKDLMQLITPPNSQPSVHMIDPLHYERVDHDDVVKKWGVPSEKLGDVLALAGDASDNIPGAPGIGPKIAQQLITEYGSLNNLLSQAESIKQKKRRESVLENREKLQLFRRLVALDDSIPISKMTSSSPFQDLSSLRMRSFNPDKLLDFYERMQLNACQRQLQQRLRSSRTDFKQPPTPEEFANVPF